jgi:tyrosyl-tRNA synthetase
MSIKDELIIKYFEVLTDVGMDEIANMAKAIKDGANPMDFKKKLASTITEMIHDKYKAYEASLFFTKTIQNNEMPDENLFKDLAIQTITKANGEKVKTIAPNAKFGSTELTRLIRQGAIRILPDGKKVESREEFLNLPTGTKVQIGRRDWYKIKIEN